VQRKFLVGCVAFIGASVVALAQSQTSGTISKFNDTLQFEDSIIVQDGGTIGIGAPPDPTATLFVNNPAGTALTGVNDGGAPAIHGVSTDFAGVRGDSTDGSGVRGDSATGTGVRGVSNGDQLGLSFGVAGYSSNGVGLRGDSDNSIAIRGVSSNGQALVVSSVNGDHIAAGPFLGQIKFRVANNGDVFTEGNVYSQGRLLTGRTVAVCGPGARCGPGPLFPCVSRVIAEMSAAGGCTATSDTGSCTDGCSIDPVACGTNPACCIVNPRVCCVCAP